MCDGSTAPRKDSYDRSAFKGDELVNRIRFNNSGHAPQWDTATRPESGGKLGVPRLPQTGKFG